MPGERGGFLVDLTTDTEKAEAVRRRIVEAGSLVVIEVVYYRLTTVNPGWANDIVGQSELPDPVPDLRG
jgi:hypothetical protein